MYFIYVVLALYCESLEGNEVQILSPWTSLWLYERAKQVILISLFN